MTPPDDIPQRCQKVWSAIAEHGPLTKTELATKLNLAEQTIREYIEDIQAEGHAVYADGYNKYHLPDDWTPAVSADTDFESGDEDDDTAGPDLDTIDAEGEPDPSTLTDRERYIATELQTGADIDTLAAELDERESVVTQHLKDLRRQGWQVYHDDTTDQFVIEGDHTLRSSEHTGTRTRKANRWWERTHNSLVRAFKALDTPDATLDADAGNEDWVVHLTDLHAGDRVRRDDGTIVYSTDDVPSLIDHITKRALALADKHNSTYDAAHLLWGGDMITNEGIYEGQFEDLDAWLDEQHDALHAPLLRQLKAFADRFPTVNVICQIGNHGSHRASGKSKQANADLILYKSIRNTVAHLQAEADCLDNVRFRIGEAKPYRNFPMRGGAVRGHLRHGQDRRPQAETSARKKQWLSTLLDHEFDVGYIGHWHIDGRIPWDGPPVIVSPSPKPAGEYVESLGERVATDGPDPVATAHGVSDDGVTGIFPIDLRKFERTADPEVDHATTVDDWQWGPDG